LRFSEWSEPEVTPMMKWMHLAQAIQEVYNDFKRGINEKSQTIGLSRNADGFQLEAHLKLRLVDTLTDGVIGRCCYWPVVLRLVVLRLVVLRLVVLRLVVLRLVVLRLVVLRLVVLRLVVLRLVVLLLVLP
jgi:hypothetical protein